MILLLKLETRSCKGCKVRNELSVVTDLSQKKTRNSDTLVGGKQDFTAEIFSGSVDTPRADKICPTNGTLGGKRRHFSGFTFNPASSMMVRTGSNDSQCLVKVALKTSTFSKIPKSFSHVIPDNKLATWRTKNGAALHSPKGTRFYCQCPFLVESAPFSLSSG